VKEAGSQSAISPQRLLLDATIAARHAGRKFSPDCLFMRAGPDYHPHPRVQQKMEVLWLKSNGCTHAEIARRAAVAQRSVQRYLDEFLEGGVDRLRRVPWQGATSALAPQQAALEDYFVAQPPPSAQETQTVIEQQTGVRRGLTPVRTFLKKLSACGGAKSG
jgi:transposase